MKILEKYVMNRRVETKTNYTLISLRVEIDTYHIGVN